jgi:hypothetical protein
MLFLFSLITLAAGACIQLPAALPATVRNVTNDATTGLPIVDLGYNLHRALTLDVST